MVIDPQLLEEGDRIVINGNLPQLTNWQNGIPLIPSETFYMWSATIELPFFVAESNPYGLFRYRYEIVTRNGIIPEGNLERSEQVLRTHYYHYFRGNFRSPRFRGWVAPQPKQLFQYFCRLIVAEYVNGLSGLEQTFKKYANLMSCFPDAHRSSVEALFEESLQVAL